LGAIRSGGSSFFHPKGKDMNKPKKTEVENPLKNFLQTLEDGFATDLNLEAKEGVEFDYGRFGRFVCRRAVHRNAGYAKAMKEKLLPYIEARGNAVEGEDDPVANRKMAEVYADTIIIGIKTSEGESIPYNDEAKKGLVEVFLKCPDMFMKLQADVSDAANYRRKRVEAEAKNSAKS
jgi:hypothetical protein